MPKGSGIPTAVRPSAHAGKVDLRASTYDQVASLLIAALILVGFFVLVLFLIWLTSRLLVNNAPPLVLLEEFSGGEGAFGAARDLEPPGLEEVEDLIVRELVVDLENIVGCNWKVAIPLLLESKWRGIFYGHAPTQICHCTIALLACCKFFG